MTDLPLGASTDADRDWRPAAASALLALVLFAVTLGGTYIYDDLYILHLDPRVKDPSRWGQYWTKDYFNGGADNLYRPLVSMSYAVQWWLHGDRPWAFHLVNVLLHGTASAGVAELARRLTRSSAVGVVAGLLFAAHPVHVEAVANVVGRAELACAAAVVWALAIFARGPLTVGRAVAIWALLVVAILSKEQGLLLPLMLLAMWLLAQKRGPSPLLAAPLSETSPLTRGRLLTMGRTPFLRGAPAGGDERAGLRTLLVLVCWTMAGYVVFRESILKFWWDRAFLDWTQNPLVRAHGADRLLMPLAILGRYALLLVAPYELSIDYGGNVIGSAARGDDPYLYLGIAAALAWGVATVIALLRRDGPMALCLLCLAMVYGLVGNVVTLIGTIFGERLMYLPSAFFLMFAAMLLVRLGRSAVVGVTIVLLALACARTLTYAARWNDRLAFHESSLRAQPESIRLYLLLSDEQIRRGDLAAADATLARARAVQPDYHRVWLQSAAVALLRDELDRAETFARRAAELHVAAHASDIWKRIAERRAATEPAATQPETTHAQPAP